MKIIRSQDCGNSPKQKFVEELTVALACANLDYLLDHITADFVWLVNGKEQIEGKQAVAAAVQDKEQDGRTQVIIKHVVSHGKKGAANGTILSNEENSIEFCCLYEFSNAKCTHVRELTTYALGGVL
ncbi:MAG: hypothetical protein KDE51_09275 [Anaerolineales bacterium]|nr:hypothetical protein [Anaerolineales bacterium]